MLSMGSLKTNQNQILYQFSPIVVSISISARKKATQSNYNYLRGKLQRSHWEKIH